MAKEQRLEQIVIAYARERSILTYKFVSPANRGVPDRVFIFPTGITLWIEFKAPGRKPTPLQAHTMVKMIRQGCLVAVVDNSIAAFDIIDKLMTKKQTIVDK
jgi:hypothetical protein